LLLKPESNTEGDPEPLKGTYSHLLSTTHICTGSG